MSPVDLGISYDEAEKESGFEPLPVRDYEFQVAEVGDDPTNKGRPMFTWRLEVINDVEFHGRSFLYSTPLPWNNPDTQEWDTGGIGLLYALCEGVGRPWEGKQFDEKGMIGMRGKLRNKHRGYCSGCGLGRDPTTKKDLRTQGACPQCGQELEPRDAVKKIFTR